MQHRAGTLHEQVAKIGITAFADMTKARLAAGRYCPGTRPIQAANCRPFLNSRALPTVATMASAVVGPMPRIFVCRRAGSESRAWASISLS